MSIPRVVAYGHDGPTLEGDPDGVATELVAALLSTVGSRWLADLMRGEGTQLHLGPRLRANRPPASPTA